MKTAIRIAAAVAACAALGAAAAEPATCERDPRATGLAQRIATMKDQMNRIEWSVDRAEQKKLMELHMKTMHESMRELRRREAGDGCRMEMMHAMMEQMMRHQLVEQDAPR